MARREHPAPYLHSSVWRYVEFAFSLYKPRQLASYAPYSARNRSLPPCAPAISLLLVVKTDLDDVNCGAEAPRTLRDLSTRRYRITSPIRIVRISYAASSLVLASRLHTLATG